MPRTLQYMDVALAFIHGFIDDVLYYLSFMVHNKKLIFILCHLVSIGHVELLFTQ